MQHEALLGIDLGGTNARVGLVENKRVVDVASAAIGPKRSVEDVLDRLYQVIDRFDAHDVGSIGVGVPSVVDVRRGIVYDVQNIPSWKEVPVKNILEERYGVPVLVNNDANCFALGEKHFGKGQDHDDMVGLILGTGFAAGVIIDGRLYSGANCGAGEIGMIPYRDSIYEYYCCGQFFERQCGVRGTEVYRRAAEGDAEALGMFEAFGKHLGEGIKTVLYAYDPGMIVLGGSVRKAYRFFQEPLRETLESFAFSRSIDRLKIEVSEHEHIAILGAAALALDATEKEWSL